MNDIANEIAYYGVQCGASKLMDYIDLNCGAIPEGDFEKVIDPSAPGEFIKLYTGIAEYRLALSVKCILEINPQSLKGLCAFCLNAGKEDKIEGVRETGHALDLINAFVLDGEAGEDVKQIITAEDKRLVWKKKRDSHRQWWDKAGIPLDIYYSLEQNFVNGLLDGSGLKYTVTDCTLFTVEKTD